MASQAKLELLHYWRSSCSWRVRWALSLKGITYTSTPINLLKDEHRQPEYLSKNPAGLLPCLLVNGKPLTESVAIIEWLEEQYPASPIFPKDSYDKALVRSFCQMIAAGIQPIQNLKVMHHVSEDAEKRSAWGRHWIQEGLKPVEIFLQKHAGTWSFGNTVTAADLFLIPQIYNAHRFAIDTAHHFPIAHRIYEAALKTEACDQAAPHRQPGAIVA